VSGVPPWRTAVAQAASGRAYLKLYSMFVWERFVLASRCFSSGVTAIKIDSIPLFDVGRWMFDVHWFFLLIKLAVAGQRRR
jgi:hypothetical protein